MCTSLVADQAWDRGRQLISTSFDWGKWIRASESSFSDRPVLEFASKVWALYLIKHILEKEKVQKHFTKRIPSFANLSYPERLAALDLEPLELHRLKFDLVLYYKCLHDLVSLPSSE